MNKKLIVIEIHKDTIRIITGGKTKITDINHLIDKLSNPLLIRDTSPHTHSLFGEPMCG